MSDKAFEAMDENKDGKISREEWLKMGMSEERFNQYKGKDGFMSKEDFKAANGMGAAS